MEELIADGFTSHCQSPGVPMVKRGVKAKDIRGSMCVIRILATQVAIGDCPAWWRASVGDSKEKNQPNVGPKSRGTGLHRLKLGENSQRHFWFCKKPAVRIICAGLENPETSIQRYPDDDGLLGNTNPQEHLTRL